MDEPVSDSDVEKIATFLIKWEDLRTHLGLDRAKEEEIRNLQTDYRGKKRECIEAWRQKEGKKATYSAFVAVAKEAQLQGLADKVMEMVQNRETTADDPGEDDQSCDTGAPSFERMVAHHGLTADQLRTICSDDVLRTLAPQMNLKPEPESGVVDVLDWEGSTDVDEEGKRQLWKQIYGNEATYERLVRNFIASDRSDLADSVCKACKQVDPKQVVPSVDAPDKVTSVPQEASYRPSTSEHNTLVKRHVETLGMTTDTQVTPSGTREESESPKSSHMVPSVPPLAPSRFSQSFNQAAEEISNLKHNLEKEKVKDPKEQEAKIENLQNEVQRIQKELEEERRKQEEAQEWRLKRLEDDIKQKEEQMKEKCKEIERLQNDADRIQKELEEERRKREEVQEWRLKRLEDDIKQKEEQMKEKDKEIEHLQNDTDRIQKELEEERRKREEALKDKERRLKCLDDDIHQKEAHLKREREENMEKCKKLTELEEQLDCVRAELEKEKAAKDELDQAIDQEKGQRVMITAIMVLLSAILAALLLYSMGITQ